MAAPLIARGLFLCEQVIFEEGTRNVTMVNAFNKRVVNEVPSETHRFFAFAELTNGYGIVPIILACQRLDTLEPVSKPRQCE